MLSGQNGGMYMSVETITIIASVAGMFFALAAGFGWMVHRMDRLEHRLSAQIDDTRTGLTSRIDRVEQEITEVKVAVARLEGPLVQRLALPR